MEQVADLHCHTYFSDGVLSPEELLQKAVKHGIYAISITDHDTVDGCVAAHELLDKYPVELINGCEFSAHEGDREYHILGYALDTDHEPLRKHLDDFRQSRFHRAEMIVEKLKKLDIHIDLDEVIEKAGVAPITRPHIAAVMLDERYVIDMKEAFIKYLGDDGPAFVKKQHYPVEDCIKLINESGGIASLAHPGNTINQSTLYKMIQHGLDGIEVIHPMHDENLQKYYHSIASQYWLLGTGGSDYHGNKEFDKANFGNFVVPYSVVESIRFHIGTR